MAFVVKDRVKETTSTTGSGTITLAGASAGFQSFAAIGNGNDTYYTILNGAAWEVGKGQYTASGTTLTRVYISSSTGALLNLTGTSDVFCTYAADKSVVLDGTTINGADVVATANIVNNAVTTDKIVNDAVTTDKLNLVSTASTPSLEARGSGSQDGYIQLNCYANTHGIKLKSPPHSAGASYTLTFPTTDGGASEFLQTNGSGVLTWAAPTNTTYSAGAGITLGGTTFTLDLTKDQSWTGSQRATAIDNSASLSFDQNGGNNFKTTTSGGGTLTFTNHTDGQSGYILLTNASNHAITAHANTKITATDLATISVTGSYLLSYFDNGTNAYITVSASYG
jgi:hypothetical protein